MVDLFLRCVVTGPAQVTFFAVLTLLCFRRILSVLALAYFFGRPVVVGAALDAEIGQGRVLRARHYDHIYHRHMTRQFRWGESKYEPPSHHLFLTELRAAPAAATSLISRSLFLIRLQECPLLSAGGKCRVDDFGL